MDIFKIEQETWIYLYLYLEIYLVDFLRGEEFLCTHRCMCLCVYYIMCVLLTRGWGERIYLLMCAVGSGGEDEEGISISLDVSS